MGIYESKYPGLKAKAVNIVMYDISFSFSIFFSPRSTPANSKSPDLLPTYSLLK